MGTGRTLAAGLAAAALAALTACSPFGGGAFTCSEDSQCGDGRCEPNGLCSYADLTCPNGWRYGDGAGSLSGFCVGDEPVADGPTADIDGPSTPIDAPPGSPDANCIIDGLDLCAQEPADPAITFGNEQLDTGTDPRCRVVAQPGGGDQVCLIYASAITVSAGATLTVTGTRPLALAASGFVTIDGTLDAGSSRTGDHGGPNADVNCGGFPTNPKNDAGGAGGAAGASFAGNGGDGGLGDSDNSLNPPGTAPGGTHFASVGPPGFARGGCKGQDGGDENGGGPNNGQGGDGGSSGGGVWLVSMAEVRVTGAGSVRATGSGGEGGESQSGGGGGGSGGVVRIGAPTITIAGLVSANGGGGGGGGGNLNGNDIDGSDGSDGGGGLTGGTGGEGAALGATVVGGNGGTGGGTAVDGLLGGPSIVGAGGGGGAAGFIVFTGTPAVTGTVSPAAIQN